MITLLPWTRLRERLALPTKISFYYYVGTLTLLNGVQCVGSGLLLWGVKESGLCIVDVTTVLYYTLLTPFVYYTFLSDFFRYSKRFLWMIRDSLWQRILMMDDFVKFQCCPADPSLFLQVSSGRRRRRGERHFTTSKLLLLPQRGFWLHLSGT